MDLIYEGGFPCGHGRRNKVVIFHHDDADGYASAAVIGESRIREKLDFRVCSHGKPMNFENIDDVDEVFILDYSFSNLCDQKNIIELSNRLKNTIIWIDHHITSDEIIKSSPVFKKMAKAGFVDTSNRYAGCMLSYFWLHDKKYHEAECPMWITYISDVDTWAHEYPNSKYFCSGLALSDLNDRFINIHNTYSFINYTQFRTQPVVDYLIEKGKTISTFREKENKKTMTRSFERKIVVNGKDHNVCCVNASGNSLLFGDAYENYDFVMTFGFNGDNWVYTMFSKDDGTDVGQIAKACGEYYGITGGGHIHAAGFSSKEFLLSESTVNLIP